MVSFSRAETSFGSPRRWEGLRSLPPCAVDTGAGPPGLEWPADWSLDFDLEERKLVRDERGVRIAREPED